MTQLQIAWNRANEPELARVNSRIAKSVLEFCRGTLLDPTSASGQFRMEQLTEWVRWDAGIAPDSPGRILRDLRQKGLIDYEVVNRRASLYRLTRIA